MWKSLSMSLGSGRKLSDLKDPISGMNPLKINASESDWTRPRP